MKLRIHHPLFAGFVGVVGFLVVGVVVLAETGLRRELVTLYQSDPERDLTLAQLFVEAQERPQLQQLAIRLRSSIGYRVTLIAADGVVLADSDIAEAHRRLAVQLQYGVTSWPTPRTSSRRP